MSIFLTGLPTDKLTRVVPVFLTVNNAYVPYAAAAIRSLMQHSDKKRYYRIIVLHDGMSLPNRVRLRGLVTRNCAIQCKKISNNLYLRAIIKYCSDKKGDGDFFSSAVYYYRAFIARLFPMCDKAIYIDSDTVILDDIGKLYDIDLGDRVIAARQDPKVTVIKEFRDYVDKAVGVPHEEYVNSGVMVMDLKKLRKMKYLSTMVELINKYEADLVAPDQDYLNLILKDKIKFLEPDWNAEPVEGEMPKDTKIVHFNLMNKPWRYKNVPQEKLFWNAARGTGFYGDLKRQLEAFTDEDREKDGAKIAALIKKAEKLAKRKKPIIEIEK